MLLGVTLGTAVIVIAALMTGCGTAKKSDVGIAFVKVEPGNLILKKSVASLIQVKRNLVFIVRVENTGRSRSEPLEVTLLINQKPKPIQRRLAVTPLDSGGATSAVFKGPFDITDLVTQIPIKVNIAPVSGKTNASSSNSASYEVRFGLGNSLAPS
jgi:hypothetical protein